MHGRRGLAVSVTVREVAEWVHGELLGDADLPISNARTLSDAEPGDITFLEHERRIEDLYKSRASAAIVPLSIPMNGRPLIRVADPLMAFVQVYQHLKPHKLPHTGVIDPSAHVHPTAVIGAGVSVGPCAVIGEGTEIGAGSIVQASAVIGRYCKIGANVILHPHAVLYDDCILGDRVIVHANAVIGADGFGYRFVKGQQIKVPQLGWVEVEEDVEIGANSTIDRGTFGPTRIGRGTKIDNLVMIAHNCQIGPHNVLAAQVGIAGSCSTGHHVVMGGQVGVADHLHIGDGTVLAAQTGVSKDVAPGQTMFGCPAMPSREFWKRKVHLNKFPDVQKDVERIKKHLGLEDE